MVFGELFNVDNRLFASKHFTVLLGAVSSTGPYEIRQTGSALTLGVNTVPAGGTYVVPHSNGNPSLPGTLGSTGTWVETDKMLYRSDETGSSQQMAAVYAVGGDPIINGWEHIPLDLPAGDYNAAITFSIVAI